MIDGGSPDGGSPEVTDGGVEPSETPSTCDGGRLETAAERFTDDCSNSPSLMRKNDHMAG